MPSKELIEKVARALFEAIDENTYKSKEDGDAWGVVDGEVNFHTQAEAAISTILAALQEHIEVLGPALRDLPLAAIKAFLETSPLGEQSE